MKILEIGLQGHQPGFISSYFWIASEQLRSSLEFVGQDGIRISPIR
ncbi:hypothetical protein GHR37_10850 [Achromobacter xylosoxidans]|nr:hypothetical protein [Achromobacter xylosoxidans]